MQKSIDLVWEEKICSQRCAGGERCADRKEQGDGLAQSCNNSDNLERRRGERG
jgi:hypothetical protein